jgi:hypothetical protein
MALPAEVQAWADEMKSLGFVEDDLRPFLARADQNEKLSNGLKGSVTATADYKRKMDLLRKQDEDAKKLLDANTTLQRELVRYKSEEVQPTLDKANRILAEQAALQARISERAKQLREKYGIEDEDIKDLVDTSQAVKDAAVKAAESKGVTVTDDGKFVKTEDFNKVALSMPRVAARLEKLGRQFDRLYAGTDKEFDSEAVISLAEKEELTLDAAFAKLYDVEARKTELASQAKEKEFSERLAKEKAAWEAKYQASPNSVRPDEGGAFITDVMNRKKDDAGGDKRSAEAPNPLDRVRQAARPGANTADVSRYVSGFRTGKHHEAAKNF